jgi:glutaminyl-tRNA synthetase
VTVRTEKLEWNAGPGNFLEDIVRADIEAGRIDEKRPLVTRFPPEPNGYLHIGHAKSICLNFGLAEKFGGKCNLRFDDTNPEAEEVEYVDAMKRDIRWLGFDWQDREFYASDYFEQLYQWAEKLVLEGKAYVDTRSEEEIRATRGDFHRPGVETAERNRPPAESLALLRRMRAGEFEEGACVLRAKIDLASKDMKLRDPLMYRIKRAKHHRTGDAWCIYPMYDWAHGQSDAIEKISHSICTLEFVNHHALYDWFLHALEMDPKPEQIEFAKLMISYTVLGKRKLQELVRDKRVDGWDDPRMPTLAGLRRRGYTPEAIRTFCERIGVSKNNSVVDVSLLEHALREHLNATSPRVMAVLRPLRVVIENFEEGRVEEIDAPYDPEDPSKGSRKVVLSRVVYVEEDDFMKVAPKKWWRLSPGAEVRLRYGCLVKCTDVVEKDGVVTELRCTWDPGSLGGNAPDGRKIRGTLHWVSEAHALDAEVRQYDRLFSHENPLGGDDEDAWLTHLNPNSLEVLHRVKVEPSLGSAKPGQRFQFERLGYYAVDLDSKPEELVFNRTITLKDAWAKIAQKQD